MRRMKMSRQKVRKSIKVITALLCAKWVTPYYSVLLSYSGQYSVLSDATYGTLCYSVLHK